MAQLLVCGLVQIPEGSAVLQEWNVSYVCHACLNGHIECVKRTGGIQLDNIFLWFSTFKVLFFLTRKV